LFEGGREGQAVAHVEKGCGILTPSGLVEIGGQEETCLVWEQRIDARDKRLAVAIVAR